MTFGKLKDGQVFRANKETYVKVMEESSHYNAVHYVYSNRATTFMDSDEVELVSNLELNLS